jgi:hypothetical protein
MADLAQLVAAQHRQALEHQAAVLAFFNSDECHLLSPGEEKADQEEEQINTGASAGRSKKKAHHRMHVTAAHVERLFVMTAQQGGDGAADVLARLKEANDVAAQLLRARRQGDRTKVTQLSKQNALALHAPYRFFSHLLQAVRRFFVHDDTPSSSSLADASSGSSSVLLESYPALLALLEGHSALLHDPTTEVHMALARAEVLHLVDACRAAAAAASTESDAKGANDALAAAAAAAALELHHLDLAQHRFYSFSALLSALRAAHRESDAYVAELCHTIAQAEGLFSDTLFAAGRPISASMARELYVNTGAGPLCVPLVHELLDAALSVPSMSALGQMLGAAFVRFEQRQEVEMELLRIFWHSYDVRQLLDGEEEEQPSAADLHRLLRASGTAAGVISFVQHAVSTLEGASRPRSVEALVRALSIAQQQPSESFQRGVLALLQGCCSSLLTVEAQVGSWGLDHVERLFALSRASHDLPVHLYALRAAGVVCDGVDALAAAVLAGRVACLDPASVGVAVLLSFVSSPSVLLLSEAAKLTVGVPELDRLIDVVSAAGAEDAATVAALGTGSSVSSGSGSVHASAAALRRHVTAHALRLLVELDRNNLQFVSIRELTHELANMAKQQ